MLPVSTSVQRSTRQQKSRTFITETNNPIKKAVTMKTTTTETSIPEEKTTSAAYKHTVKSQLGRPLPAPTSSLPLPRRTLRSWISKNTELQAALTRSGYTGKAILLTSCTSRAVLSIFGRALESSPVPDEPTSRLIYSYSGHIRQREPESAALGKRPAQPYHVPF